MNFVTQTPREMSTCSLKSETNRIHYCAPNLMFDCDLCYGNVLMIRNWQWIPLLRYFFGLHWCLYRCYRWCRRSLGLLHQLEGFRQRYCFRRPRNLCSWYKIIRVQPPQKSLKEQDANFAADSLNYLFQDSQFFPLVLKITSSTFTNGFVISPCTLLRQV